eukprot:scaffold8847_cov112-Isochrysis_galbana.AAC.12
MQVSKAPVPSMSWTIPATSRWSEGSEYWPHNQRWLVAPPFSPSAIMARMTGAVTFPSIKSSALVLSDFPKPCEGAQTARGHVRTAGKWRGHRWPCWWRAETTRSTGEPRGLAAQWPARRRPSCVASS